MPIRAGAGPLPSGPERCTRGNPAKLERAAGQVGTADVEFIHTLTRWVYPFDIDRFSAPA